MHWTNIFLISSVMSPYLYQSFEVKWLEVPIWNVTFLHWNTFMAQALSSIYFLSNDGLDMVMTGSCLSSLFLKIVLLHKSSWPLLLAIFIMPTARHIKSAIFAFFTDFFYISIALLPKCNKNPSWHFGITLILFCVFRGCHLW